MHKVIYLNLHAFPRTVLFGIFRAFKTIKNGKLLKYLLHHLKGKMDLFNLLKKMRILLIDDDEWIRDSMTLFFESEDCRIKALETAEEGLKEIKAHSYDIIIIDYKLPGINGLEFLEQIQALYPNTIRILISAYGNSEVLDRAKTIGIHDFIEKPFTSETIEKSLSRIMKGWSQK